MLTGSAGALLVVNYFLGKMRRPNMGLELKKVKLTASCLALAAVYKLPPWTAES
jgi:hypothetical protein